MCLYIYIHVCMYRHIQTYVCILLPKLASKKCHIQCTLCMSQISDMFSTLLKKCYIQSALYMFRISDVLATAVLTL